MANKFTRAEPLVSWDAFFERASQVSGFTSSSGRRYAVEDVDANFGNTHPAISVICTQ